MDSVTICHTCITPLTRAIRSPPPPLRVRGGRLPGDPAALPGAGFPCGLATGLRRSRRGLLCTRRGFRKGCRPWWCPGVWWGFAPDDITVTRRVRIWRVAVPASQTVTLDFCVGATVAHGRACLAVPRASGPASTRGRPGRH